MTTTQRSPKDQISHAATFDWGKDWGGVDGAPEPTAGQIVRSVATSGWAGHQRTYREVSSARIRNGYSDGWVRFTRPATFTDHGDGAKSGHGSQTMANRERAADLADRYGRFCQYMKEARHGWEEGRKVHYADNSVEVEERSQLTGEIRTRVLVHPGGDVCY